jgi:MarR family transcriptional regulator, organic hydroperoxide resistance regulator
VIHGSVDRRSTSLSHATVRLFRLVNRATNRAVAAFDLSGEQAHVLMALWEMGPVTIGVLQRELALSSATLTGAIDRMEKQGLVRRTPSPDDRRASVIEPRVPAATKAKILAAVDRSDHDCFAAITAAERTTLLRLLTACATDLEAR